MRSDVNWNEEAYEEAWREFNEEAAGVIRLVVVRPQYLPSAPPEFTVRFIDLLCEFKKLVEAGRKTLCLACEHEFKPAAKPWVFVVTMPHRDDAKNASLAAVCDECAKRSDQELIEINYQQLKEAGIAIRSIGVCGPQGHG